MKLKYSVAKEGFPFYGSSAGLALVFIFLKLYWLAIILACFSVFCLFFFRDPDRIPEGDDHCFVSPADGKVLGVEKHKTHPLFSEKCVKISIFMSVFNVHINRSPVAGTVTNSQYKPGRFFPAYQDLAAVDNEQNELWIRNGAQVFALTQIAGILARRIRCYAKVDDVLQRGQKIGLIQFGSRVDLHLPPDFQVSVLPGQKVLAGKSIIGHFKKENEENGKN
ncbi:phosphatidylserine decarboxylase family protein [candidate division CSSED10-310 bacterium]|uniref:Phosphatidylserine decarboxylase proenzyme n=1 Tax=candidate division CSSED10-310 bacterium TaxID=2855610 RepID=A0ABV6YYW5_UNCC1